MKMLHGNGVGSNFPLISTMPLPTCLRPRKFGSRDTEISKHVLMNPCTPFPFCILTILFEKNNATYIFSRNNSKHHRDFWKEIQYSLRMNTSVPYYSRQTGLRFCAMFQSTKEDKKDESTGSNRHILKAYCIKTLVNSSSANNASRRTFNLKGTQVNPFPLKVRQALLQGEGVRCRGGRPMTERPTPQQFKLQHPQNTKLRR